MKIWQTYIEQAETRNDHFFRLERLFKAYLLEPQLLAFFSTDSLFTHAWFKYASKVRAIKDVFDLMMEHKIGFHKESTFVKIASFYEKHIFDLREADRILRVGAAELKKRELFQQLGRLEQEYRVFARRVAQIQTEVVLPKLDSIRHGEWSARRPLAESTKINRANEAYLCSDCGGSGSQSEKLSFTKD